MTIICPRESPPAFWRPLQASYSSVLTSSHKLAAADSFNSSSCSMRRACNNACGIHDQHVMLMSMIRMRC